MTMTLKDIRNVLRQAEKESAPTIWPGDAGDMADAIDAHIIQPAQSVDVEKVREVIASLYAPGHPSMTAAADKLTAALQEKGNG